MIRLIAAILSLNAVAAVAETAYLVQSGELKYTIDHALKTAHGVSREPKGKIVCQTEDKNCEFLIAVAAKTVDSENSNRDAHMRETVKEALHPVVIVSGHMDQLSESLKSVQVQVDFAGKKSAYSTQSLQIKRSGSKLTLDGKLVIQLSHHEIERPSLLGASIKDDVPVEFHLELNR